MIIMTGIELCSAVGEVRFDQRQDAKQQDAAVVNPGSAAQN